MHQFYKDFIINGTKDRAFSSELDKEIVGNINNFIFGRNSENRIREIIKDYKDEISKNWVANVIDNKSLDYIIDTFTRMNSNILEFYTNADSTNDNKLFTISSMQSLVEINDYTDLIKNMAVVDEKMSNKERVNRFNSLVAFKNIFTTKSKELKDEDHNRVYAERMQIDVPGETNCYIYKIQLRVVINDVRVVYNHYCILRNDMDYSLQLLDKEYELGLLKENNKTIEAMYKKSRTSTHTTPLLIGDVINLNEIIGNKYTFAVVNNLNKNSALFNNLNNQLVELESRLKNKLEAFGIRINSELNSSKDFIVSAVERLYSLNKKLSQKELDIAISTIIAAAINFNVVERNIKYKAIDVFDSISAHSLISIIKLCMKNLPYDIKSKDDRLLIEQEFEALKRKKILETTEVSRGLLDGLKEDLMKMMSYFMLTFKDLIIKSMYEENAGLFFKAPEDKEDKISMLIAVESITLNKNIKFSLRRSSRRISNLTSDVVYNTLVQYTNEIINNLNVAVPEKINKKSEAVIEELNNLKLEEVLG